MKTFSLPPGLSRRARRVGADDRVADPDGLRCRRPAVGARDADVPAGHVGATIARAARRVSVLEDTNGDGKMDKKTVFADKLSMPRALKVLESRRARRRAAEPVADEGHRRRPQGRHQGTGRQHLRQPERRHRAQRQQPVLGDGQRRCIRPNTSGTCACKNGKFEPLPALSRGQWQVSQDDAGRIYRNVNDSPLFVDYTPSRYFLRNPNGARTRGLYELLIEQRGRDRLSGAEQPRRQPRLPRSVLPRRRSSSIVIQGAGTPDHLSRRRLSEGAARQRVHHRLADQSRAPVWC